MGLGNVLRQTGKYEAALEAYQRALDLLRARKVKGVELGIRVGRGQAYGQLGKWTDAREEFRVALGLAKELGREQEAQTLLQLGDLYYGAQKFAEALPQYLQAVAVVGTEAPLQLQAASAHAKAGHAYRLTYEPDRAREEYQAALSSARGLPRAWAVELDAQLGLGLLHAAEAGKDTEAQEEFRASLRAAAQLGRDREVWTLFQIGDFYFFRDQHARALERYQAILDLPEDGTWLVLAKAMARQRIGHTYQRTYRLDEAIPVLEAAVDSASQAQLRDVEVYARVSLGLVRGLRGEGGLAAEQFRKALEVARGFRRAEEAIVQSQHGVLDSQLGNQKEALAHYGEALQVYEALQDPLGQARTRNQMGTIHSAAGQYDLALAQFDRAAALAGSADAGGRAEQAQAHLNAGRAQHTLGHLREAIRRLDSAKELYAKARDGTGEARTAVAVGDIRRDQGDYAGAARAYEEGLQKARAAGAAAPAASALLGNAHLDFLSGLPGDAVKKYGEASQEAARINDKRLLAIARTAVADLWLWQGLVREAWGVLQECKPLTEGPALYAQRARLLRSVGRYHFGQGAYLQAMQDYEQAVNLCRQTGLRQEEALAQRDLGSCYQALSQFDEALDRNARALRLARSVNGAHAIAVAQDGLGAVYQAWGRYSRALVYYTASLETIRGASLRGLEAGAVLAIGDVYRAQGQAQQAGRQFLAAVELAQQHKIYNAGFRMDVAADLAALQRLMGNNAAALAEYQAFLKLAQATQNRPREGDGHANLGALYLAMGNFADAEAEYGKARRIAEDTGDLRLGLSARTGQAGVLASRGQPKEALDEYQKILLLAEKNKLVLREVAALQGIGGAEAARGNFIAAITAYDKALLRARGMGAEPEVATVRGNLGYTYYAAGDHLKSLDQYIQGRDLARKIGAAHQELTCLSGLAFLWLVAERHDVARQRYEEVRAKAVQMGLLFEQAAAALGQCSAYLGEGQPEKALPLCEEVSQASVKIGSRQLEAHALLQRGRARLALRPPARNLALQDFQSALATAESIAAPALALRCQTLIGDLYRKEGDWASGILAYRKAIPYLEQVRPQGGDPGLRVQFFAHEVAAYDGLAGCLLRAQPVTDAARAEAFRVSELAKARALVDLLAGGRMNITKAMTEEERRRETMLLGELRGYEEQLKSAGTGNYLDLRRKYQQALTAYDRFRDRLYIRHPTLRTQRGQFEPLTLDCLGHVLFAGGAKVCLLSYLVGERGTWLFVLTPGADESAPPRLTVHPIPAGLQQLAREVEAFARDCADPGDAENLYSESHALYRRLIAPAEEQLRGAEHVVLVPDRALHALPFQALLDGPGEDKKGTFLAEKYALSYAPSLTALVKMREWADREQQAKPGPALVMGNPTFSQTGTTPLPFAEDEAGAVARLLGTTALTRNQATETRAKQLLGPASYVHLATHGKFKDDAPMLSWVLLAADQEQDGYLHAYELADLELSARLVVLSACETAEGASYAGEDLLGLGWSLFVAGSPSCVLTQWRVATSDVNTRLMTVFYQELLGGKGTVSKAEALRRAQRKILGDGQHRRPYYWAAFVQLGDWRN
jgi:CHAT domain-containing protein